jgi:hypothetical protein
MRVFLGSHTFFFTAEKLRSSKDSRDLGQALFRPYLGLVGLKKLTDLSKLRPDPRHLQSQKRFRKSLNLLLMELLG